MNVSWSTAQTLYCDPEITSNWFIILHVSKLRFLKSGNELFTHVRSVSAQVRGACIRVSGKKFCRQYSFRFHAAKIKFVVNNIFRFFTVEWNLLYVSCILKNREKFCRFEYSVWFWNEISSVRPQISRKLLGLENSKFVGR